MRVLILGVNYSPELTGIGKYSGEMAEWLAARGHDVRVVAAPPYYPEWRVANGYSPWVYRREILAGVTIWRCPIWVPSRPSGAKRLFHLASIASSSLPAMLRQIFWKPHIVMVVEPPLMCAPTALLVARLCGGRAWLHVQDFEVDAAFDLGLLPSGRIRDWALRVEGMILRRFDHISTISRNMLARLSEKRVEANRCVFFPNWVDTKTIYPLPHPSRMRTELGIAPETIVALYSGNIGEKQGLEIVLEAAQKLVGHSRIQFVMCGDGAARQRLAKAYQGLHNVMWIPLQPLDNLNELLNLADIHLLPQRGDATDLVMPSKLTGMLASGRTVMATLHPGTQLAEVVGTRGRVTPPGNVDALAGAIMELAHDSAMRLRLGTKARDYAVKELDKEAILRQFEQALMNG